MMRVSFYLSILLFVFNLSDCYSQGRTNYWPLGYSSFGNPLNGGLTVDFPNNSFNFYDHPREMDLDFTNAAICNDTGALQFYTNGVYIANAVDDTMLNGNGINPSFYTTQFYQNGLRLPQADIIIPKPGNDSLYYFFHETEDFPWPLYKPKYLYNSIINMNGDSGKGEVTAKNNVLITDTLFVCALTACKHANGRDWWLLVPEYGNSLGYYTVLITPDTMQVYSHNYYPVNGTEGGQACFSPDGSKYVLSYWWGVAFFEFDRCSGTLTLIDQIYTPNSIYYLGASVSPNSRYAYVAFNGYYIFQFDLQAANISASIDTVAIYDGYQSFGIPAFFWLNQLAPDGKIYIATGNGTFVYHTIDSPDSAGLACNMLQHNIIFPHFNNTIPNFPNYDLGRLQGSPCDTLLWTNLTPSPSPRGEGSVVVNPNPASNSVNIKYAIATNQNMLFVLYDSYGKEVLRKTFYGTFKNLLVATDMLSDGVYFYSATVEKAGIRETGKLVIVH